MNEINSKISLPLSDKDKCHTFMAFHWICAEVLEYGSAVLSANHISITAIFKMVHLQKLRESAAHLVEEKQCTLLRVLKCCGSTFVAFFLTHTTSTSTLPHTNLQVSLVKGEL